MTLVAILTDTPQTGAVDQTTYGASAPIREVDVGGTPALVCSPGYADPRATVRALKDRGATHLWLCESVGALSTLLEPGDVLVPDDFIDGTRGQLYTYFSEKAGGFVQQVPPFDPASREALLTSLTTHTFPLTEGEGAGVRVFRRGVYVCVSSTRLETPAEALFWTRAGGHVVGRFLSPSLALARELEMGVAVLGRVTRAGGERGESAPFETYEPVLARALRFLTDS